MSKEALFTQELALLAYATEQLSTIPGLRIIGTAPDKIAVISFVIDGIHPQDLPTLLIYYHFYNYHAC